ncbi:uncharacterized protein LOC126836014 isoform X2 [Adelges cooleyi]|uniref:uncharacterized protein LOC126836014 isoform X2 n=1 Tax=Adelges cooleyi TaxID=133065 RepID=UPI00217F610B|nr:uncharacterized protein LOC126836014 isoform X2 [Adelges cooleyi]
MVNYCILLIAIFILHPNNVNANCQDYFGRNIVQGMHYVPGPDTCTLCVCDNSVAKWCKAVLCSPPQDCKSFTVGSTCCEFNCLDDSLNDGGDIDFKGDNINARSIASTITAFLFFILIVFLINRLHKRNIMSNVEVFANPNSPQMGDGVRGIGYISGYMNFPRSIGNDLYYGDHATLHIPLWKTYYPRGDAPPPYDEAIAMPQQMSQNFIGMGEMINHRTIPATATETNQNMQQPCILEQESTANQPLLDNALKKTVSKESVSNEKGTTTSSDDFREECENCKHDQKLAEGYDGNFPEPETMTLERRPQITHEHPIDRNEPRSSMTLPGDGRHGRSHVIKDKNRDERFKETIVKEDSISDDENS